MKCQYGMKLQNCFPFHSTTRICRRSRRPESEHACWRRPLRFGALHNTYLSKERNDREFVLEKLG